MNNLPNLWTKDYILNCIICTLINLAYYLTMVVITDYSVKELHSSLAQAGLACGIIILGVLASRLLIGRSIERIGTKKALYASLVIFLISTLANINSTNMLYIFFIRFVQGIGFGGASTATGTIMAEIVPNQRRGEGTSYFAISVTFATAIGPFLGIFVYQNGLFNNNLYLGAVLLALSLVITFFLAVPKIELTEEQINSMKGFSLGNFFESKAMPIALLTFFVSLGFAGLLGFMTTFTNQINLLKSGKYFFIFYAIFAVISRPMTGKLFDRMGDFVVMVPAFILNALGLFFLGIAHSSMMIFLSGALIGMGFGTYMSCSQAIAIRVSPKHRMGLATSTFFIFMDLGVGLGPLILGTIIPLVHYRGMYQLLALLVLVCMVPYCLMNVRRKKKTVAVEC